MTNYLTHNSLELVVIGIAFCVSKRKLIPFYLIIYVGFMTILFKDNQAYLDFLYKNNMWGIYNNASVRVLILESLVMFSFAMIAFVNRTRMRMAVQMLILVQSVVSAISGIIFGLSIELDRDFTPWFDLHYSLQSIFVILYCVIAWMCVYYSRTGKI